MKEDQSLHTEINRKDEMGFTPLFLASSDGEYQTCKTLIEHGADINVRDSYGLTPFHIACCNDRRSVCMLLVEKGADIDTTDNIGHSPLRDVCRREFHELIDFILSTLVIKNKRKFNEKEMLKVLDMLPDKYYKVCNHDPRGHAEHTQSCYTTIFKLCMFGKYDVLKKLIEDNSLSIHDYTRECKNGLHISAEYRQFKVCELLLENGMKLDIDALDADWNTPLHIACISGSISICRLLVDNGASIDIKNKNGALPLDLAILHNHRLIISFLEEKKLERLWKCSRPSWR
jgi:ankyrin repeat protein